MTEETFVSKKITLYIPQALYREITSYMKAHGYVNFNEFFRNAARIMLKEDKV